MKKVIVSLLFLFISYIGFSQSYSDDLNKNVVQKVILINASPYEVLMNQNGDVIAKLNYLPDYFKTFENGEVDLDSLPDISTMKKVDLTKFEEDNNPIKFNDDDSSENQIDIFFKGRTALLQKDEIKKLNQIINALNSGQINTIKLYGFANEPEYRLSILSERRFESILAYMKIKGVDIDQKVIEGNTVAGQSNKIVVVELK
ncbi:MAG: hypothetical protein R2771_01650 [Saprospiraceae bacterium]